MKTIKLNTEALMPMMGLGTYLSKPGEVYQAVRWAVKLGYRHIDCAPIYENQAEIGQALHDAVAEGDIKRSELFLTSKLWNDRHNIDDVRAACEETLHDLQTDYLDLYLMHWPVALRKGVKLPQKDDDWISLEDEPLWETWSEMEKLYNEGKVKAIGVSNFTAEKLGALIEKTQVTPAVNQVESHPWLNQQALLEFCQHHNVVMTAYAPLGAESSQGSLLADATVLAIAEKNRCTAAQVVLAWQMARGVAVIPKSVQEKRLRENYAALAVELDEDDMTKLNGLNKGYRFFDGHEFVNAHKGYAVIF
jgi:alcohol dehydrogenase (NADP+)